MQEISVFPDNMFEFASVETAILLGKKAGRHSSGTPQRIRFRRVREKSTPDFKRNYNAPQDQEIEAIQFERNPDCRLVLPELFDLWEACRELPVLGSVASVGQGFIFKSIEKGLPPDAVTFSSSKQVPTQQRGWKNVGRYYTHELPKAVWLNLDKSVIRRPLHGTIRGKSQVVLNYAPISRGQWRLKAVADTRGHPAGGRFLLVRTLAPPWTTEILWAVMNSPLANAFAYAHTNKRDMNAGVFRTMPVPDLRTQDVEPLTAAVTKYREAALAFAAKVKAAAKKTVKAKQQGSPQSEQQTLLFEIEADEEIVEVAVEPVGHILRALHWRVDAEVLRLYNFSDSLQRELLDLFAGVVRLGVPFEQREYIPPDFRDVLTLDELLRITDEWPSSEERRTALLEKKFDVGLNSSEEGELLELRRLLTLRRKFLQPFPPPEMQELFQRVLAKTGGSPHDNS